MKTSSPAKSAAAMKRAPAGKPPKRSALAASAPDHRFWLYAIGAAAALFAVFAVYSPALNGPFLLDDTYLPYALPSYEHAPLILWIRGVRPLTMFSFWLNFQTTEWLNPGPYHAVNVLLHVANGALVFLCVRKILGWARVDSWKREVLSAFAAGLFLFHPLQTESVSYIAGRSEELSLLFILAAYAVFLYRKSAAASWGVSAAVLVLFGAACLSKEQAAILPGLLVLTDYYWNPGFSFEGLRRNWRLYVPMLGAAALAGVFVLRVLATATTAGFGLANLSWYQYFFTQCRAIWRYILFYLLPTGQNIDHDFPVSRNLLAHGAIAGLAGLILLAAAAWFFRRRFPVASYGALTSLLLFVPTSSVVPIRDTLVEHRMYLPFLGFVLATVGLLRWWKASRTVFVYTLAGVLLAEAALAYRRNRLYGDAIAVWADSAAKSPDKIRPNFQLAYAFYNAGRCPEAVSQYARTARLEPAGYSLLIDWALAEDCAGNPAGALAKLQQAAGLEKTAHVYSQIGMEYAKLAQYPQALDAIDASLRLDPNFEMSYVYRANIYTIQGEKARAAADYQRALAIDPENQVARDGLMKASR